MFEKNDKALHTARGLISALIVIFMLGALITGIVVSAISEEWVFILISFGGLIVGGLMWLVTDLYFSFLIDIKLIRNKLYGESNDGLDVYLKGNRAVTAAPSASAYSAKSTDTAESTDTQKGNSAVTAAPSASAYSAKSTDTQKSSDPAAAAKSEQASKELTGLQRLLASGVITNEEYEARKRKLTEGK